MLEQEYASAFLKYDERSITLLILYDLNQLSQQASNINYDGGAKVAEKKFLSTVRLKK